MSSARRWNLPLCLVAILLIAILLASVVSAQSGPAWFLPVLLIDLLWAAAVLWTRIPSRPATQAREPILSSAPFRAPPF